MKRILLTITITLTAFLATYSQTVDESASRVYFEKNDMVAKLRIKSASAQTAAVGLSLLNPNDTVKIEKTVTANLVEGDNDVELRMPFGYMRDVDDLIWKRLRYTIKTSEGKNTGLISLSQLMPDLFELTAVSSEYVSAGTTFVVRVTSVHPVTRVPIPNVEIKGLLSIELEGPDEKEFEIRAEALTDSTGYGTLLFSIPEDIKPERDYGDADVELSGARNGILSDSEKNLDILTSDLGVMINTDKPLYQPGQTIFVRGLAGEQMVGKKFAKPLVDTELEFIIQDEDNTTLYRESVTTTRFGIASINWQIPDNAKLGRYSIKIEIGDTEQSGYSTFKVSRYELPNFIVKTKPDQDYYLPKQKKAKVKIDAVYLFGKPVTGGKVKVVRENDREWNFDEQKWDIEEGEVYEGKTDKDGVYEAKIDLSKAHKELAEEEFQKFEDINFTAYFTDSTTNITEQRRFDLRISKEDIHVYFSGLPYGRKNDRLPMRFYVTTSLADGTPAAADVEIKGKFESDGKRKTLARVKTNRYGAARVEMRLPECPDGSCFLEDLDMEAIARSSDKRTGKELNDEVSVDEDAKEIQIKTSKIIFKKNEPIGVEVFSSEKKRRILVDVLRNNAVVATHEVEVADGYGKLTIPYRSDFENNLLISAYFYDDDDGNMISATAGIIYPKPVALSVEAVTDKETYRPATEVSLKYGVSSPGGPGGETAFGVYVLDRAVEERALTDSNFGGGFDPFSDFRRAMGNLNSFGGVSQKQLEELDLSKEVPEDLELAAEIMLRSNVLAARPYNGELTSPAFEFVDVIKNQLSLVQFAFNFRYGLNFEHPTDQDSLDRILNENGIDFSRLRDPWGSPYYARFSIDRQKNVIEIRSLGPNKAPDEKGETETSDDFTAQEIKFEYFTETGRKIDKAVAAYTSRTGVFVRSRETLAKALGEAGMDISELKDRWGYPYEFEFSVNGRTYVLNIESKGPDRRYSYSKFGVWRNNTDYFGKDQEKINKILEEHVNTAKAFPKDEKEFKEILKKAGFDFDSLRDGWGRPYFIESKTEKIFSDRVTIETVSGAAGNNEESYIITPVTREIASFTIRSYGENGKSEEYDWRKPRIARFAGMVSEQAIGDAKPKVVVPKTVLTAGQSAIYGTVTDQTGAVIPGATVTAVSFETGVNVKTVVTDENGAFLIGNLSAGSYQLQINSPGFKQHRVNGLEIARENVIQINATLVAGDVAMTVDVVSDASVLIDSSNATINTTISRNLIESLPNGRNFGSLLRISAGVLNQPLSGGFQMDGASGAENTFIVNGQEVTNFRTGQINVVTRPGSADFEAEYGGTAGKANQTETPRVRNYFPETLLWAPELVSDDEGNVTMRFKLADNITTWKIYAIASNLEGRIGVSEKEIKTFQPFFVDLLPPRILTKGDEISLPVQVRNYTEKTQDVEVSMRGESWFEFFDPLVKPLATTRSAAPKPVATPDSVVLNISTNLAGKAAADKYTGGGGSPTTLEVDGMDVGDFSSSLKQVKVKANSTENAVFDFRATTKAEEGVMNVTALADGESDAIEKPVTVNPDGKEVVQSETRIFRGNASFDVDFPANALAGTSEAELKIYPNLFAHVSESVGGLLKRPYGCGEQTISSTYPNLMILKFTKEDNRLRQTAKTYLQKGYERLLGYQVESGGFSYWGGKDEANIALTAYALRFLNDAKEFIDVDDTPMRRAKEFLASKQQNNGMWSTVYTGENDINSRRTWMISTYVVRSLAETVTEKDFRGVRTSLDLGLLALSKENEKLDEPYSMANLGLAYVATGQSEKAAAVAARLRSMAKREGDDVYWKLETNTPFFGWGTAGRLETTALVLQLLQQAGSTPEDEKLVSDGVGFLLRNKDRYGVWYSTQATINVLDAILGLIEDETGKELEQSSAGVFVNGEKIKDIELPPANEPGFPLAVDITQSLNPVANRIEFRTDAGQTLQAQVVARHYISWDDFDGGDRQTNASRQLALDYECDRYQAAPTNEITCKVKAERVGFRGYGMLLAEIGLPPGADVDRASLDKAKNEDWSFSRYDVLPDRIVIYMWSKAGGTEFDFKFKPRYGINAQTPASFVYDYYNEEAKAIVKPLRFIVR